MITQFANNCRAKPSSLQEEGRGGQSGLFAKKVLSHRTVLVAKGWPRRKVRVIYKKSIVPHDCPLSKRMAKADGQDHLAKKSLRSILFARGQLRINYQTNYMGFAFSLLEILLIPIA